MLWQVQMQSIVQAEAFDSNGCAMRLTYEKIRILMVPQDVPWTRVITVNGASR